MDGLAARGHDPALANATGTLRFEVVDGKRTERWLLTVSKGELAVSRRNARADVTLRAPRATFEQLFGGTMNPTAAFLRGALELEGDVELIVLVQRLLPGPAPARRTARRR
jgi:predicted lipid carrier protein YhbT